MRQYEGPVRLQDSLQHRPQADCELLIVEGDSACKAVNAVRDIDFQAVLPMQGKPLNAAKASRTKISQNELFHSLFVALGFPDRVPNASDPASDLQAAHCRYSRIILLLDPDADGIHCGALMLIFFYRMLLPLLEEGMLSLVRAPLHRVRLDARRGIAGHASDSPVLYAYTDSQARKLKDELDSERYTYTLERYRGLASMDSNTLWSTCVNPTSRRLHTLRPQDAVAAIRLFGGKNPRGDR